MERFEPERQQLERLGADFEARVVANPNAWVAEAFAADQSVSWRNAVEAGVQRRLATIEPELRTRFDALLNGKAVGDRSF